MTRRFSSLFTSLVVFSVQFSVTLLAFGTSGCATNGRSGEPELNFLGEIINEESARRKDIDVTIPASANAHYEFLRGELAYSAEKYDEALKFYQRAAELERGKAPLLRTRLAQIYIRKGDLTKALSQLDRAEKDYGTDHPEDPQLLELRAGILASMKRTPEAITTYRKLIALPSETPNEEAYVLLAGLFASEKRFAEAEQTLNELLTKAPDSPIGVYYLARMNEIQGKSAEAEKHYRRAIELSPETETLQLDLARILGIQRKFDEAVAIAERITKTSPQNQAARALLGQLLLGDNRYDDALLQYEKLRDSSADPDDARLKIALIKLERRDFQSAETELNLILANDPDNSVALYYSALSLSGQGKIAETISTIKKITPKRKYYRESRMLGAFLLRQNKDMKGASELLSELAETENNDAKLLNLIASLQREAGQIDDAIATTERIIQLEPQNDQLFFLLGVLYDEADQKQEAIVAMRRAIELNPRNDEALNYLGYTLAEQSEQLQEAEALIVRALAVEPQNGYYLDSLAWVYHRQGKNDEALSTIVRAITIVPNDAVLLEHHAVILEANGRPNEALVVAKTALAFVAESDDKDVGLRLQQLIQKLSEPTPGQ